MGLISDPEFMKTSVEVVDLCILVQQICDKKREFFFRLKNDDKANEWEELMLVILQNVQRHLKFLTHFVKFVDNPTDITHNKSFDGMTCGLISCALRYCYKHPSERDKVFPHLYLALTGNMIQYKTFKDRNNNW